MHASAPQIFGEPCPLIVTVYKHAEPFPFLSLGTHNMASARVSETALVASHIILLYSV